MKFLTVFLDFVVVLRGSFPSHWTIKFDVISSMAMELRVGSDVNISSSLARAIHQQLRSVQSLSHRNFLFEAFGMPYGNSSAEARWPKCMASLHSTSFFRMLTVHGVGAHSKIMRQRELFSFCLSLVILVKFFVFASFPPAHDRKRLPVGEDRKHSLVFRLPTRSHTTSGLLYQFKSPSRCGDCVLSLSFPTASRN